MAHQRLSKAYWVEYLCTANPSRPVWRTDYEYSPFADLAPAIAHAKRLHAAGRPMVRVLDDHDQPAFQYGWTIAA